MSRSTETPASQFRCACASTNGPWYTLAAWASCERKTASAPDANSTSKACRRLIPTDARGGVRAAELRLDMCWTSRLEQLDAFTIRTLTKQDPRLEGYDFGWRGVEQAHAHLEQ